MFEDLSIFQIAKFTGHFRRFIEDGKRNKIFENIYTNSLRNIEEKNYNHDQAVIGFVIEILFRRLNTRNFQQISLPSLRIRSDTVVKN